MKLKIMKYQETLNDKPIDGFRTKIKQNWEEDFHEIIDADEWIRCGEKVEYLPSDYFKRYKPVGRFGETLILEIDSQHNVNVLEE